MSPRDLFPHRLYRFITRHVHRIPVLQSGDVLNLSNHLLNLDYQDPAYGDATPRKVRVVNIVMEADGTKTLWLTNWNAPQ